MSADSEVMVEMPKPKVVERPAGELNGWPMMGLSFVLVVGGIALFVWGLDGEQVGIILLGVLAFVFGAIVAAGPTPVSPGQARVLQILGRYAGTIRTDGLRWVNPLAARREISTRIRNHETTVAKVNDSDGNPIEIAAVVVWQVEDTAQARFEVDDFVAFVAIQTETAVRHIANSYPYDVHDESGGMSLRDSTDEITEKLSTEIGARVQAAGVRVIESRITHLAYAPEIAQAMLRRQQANAVVAARTRIVEGAVGMVEMALEQLSAKNVVVLDEERKAQMVSNLLVVLCSEHETQPVVNAGTLYA